MSANIIVASLLAVGLQLLLVTSGNCVSIDSANEILEIDDAVLTAGVNFLKPENWGARPPKKPAGRLSVLPAPYVIISHTASQACSTQERCSQICRSIQSMHIDQKGWDNIGYNFLVGGDGSVYVGRGWDVQGAHTYGYNSKSIGISFIGTFSSVTPTDQQLKAAQQLLEFGMLNGKLAGNYKLLGHRQVSATLSPGDALYKIIQTWPHWAPKP